LRLLERRTHRSGKDTVDHGVNGSDDYANALCGSMYLCMSQKRKPRTAMWGCEIIYGDGPAVNLSDDNSLPAFGGSYGQ